MTDVVRGHVPPGGATVLPLAGWYPDPGNPRRARFWDGARWTDEVAGAPPRDELDAAAVPGAGGSASGTNHFLVFLAVAVVSLAAIVGAIALVARTGGGESTGSAPEAEYVCRAYVRDRLQSPDSATFSGLHTEEPVAGSQWVVTGSVDSRTVLGEVRTSAFTCTVTPAEGPYWRLVRLRIT